MEHIVRSGRSLYQAKVSDIDPQQLWTRTDTLLAGAYNLLMAQNRGKRLSKKDLIDTSAKRSTRTTTGPVSKRRLGRLLPEGF